MLNTAARNSNTNNTLGSPMIQARKRFDDSLTQQLGLEFTESSQLLDIVSRFLVI